MVPLIPRAKNFAGNICGDAFCLRAGDRQKMRHRCRFAAKKPSQKITSVRSHWPPAGDQQFTRVAGRADRARGDFSGPYLIPPARLNQPDPARYWPDSEIRPTLQSGAHHTFGVLHSYCALHPKNRSVTCR